MTLALGQCKIIWGWVRAKERFAPLQGGEAPMQGGVLGGAENKDSVKVPHHVTT